MSESILHPTPDRLEAYVEEALPDADRAVLESHLEGCGRCRSEVEEWRALFAALEGLPAFDPSPGFAERVMGGVKVRVPWWVRAAALLGRFVPQTTSGWVLVAALVSLPAFATGGAAAWLFTRPGLSPQALWIFLSQEAWTAVSAGSGWLVQRLLTTDAALLVAQALERLSGAGTEQVVSIATLLAALTVTSAWILYTHLIRPATRERGYVSYGF